MDFCISDTFGAYWNNINQYIECFANHCKIITSLEGTEDLVKLDLIGCTRLKTLKEIETLHKLTNFSISGSSNLTSTMGLEHLKLLIHFYLEFHTPAKFPEILSLASLANLTLFDSSIKITSMIEIGCIVSLTSLCLSVCHVLVSLKGIENLIKLTDLRITHCGLLTCVKEIRYLTKLTNLTLSNNDALASVDGIEYLESLTKLDLSCCAVLRHIPTNIICLEHLTNIYKGYCFRLSPIFYNLSKPYSLNVKDELFQVLDDEIKKNTDTWTRHDHEKFGSNVNKMFVTLLLCLQQIFPNFEIDPELIEETLQQYQQCHRRDLAY